MRHPSLRPVLHGSIAVIASLLAAALAPAAARAQATVEGSAAATAMPPRWGAELSFGGPSGVALLRFRSPAHAWVLAADASYFHRAGLPGDESDHAWEVGTRLGFRRYGGDTPGLRPVWGTGLVGRVGRFSGDLRFWQAGLYGELGATYFFTRHVSLGAVGDLQATYGERDLDIFAGDGTLREWALQASLVRVMAAVYF